MKVALTCYKLKSSNDVSILSNGHHLNVLLWYHFFENCGYDVIYISNEDSTGKITSDGRDYNIVSIYDYINNIWKEKNNFRLCIYCWCYG